MERNKRKVFTRNFSLHPPALFQVHKLGEANPDGTKLKSRYAQQTNSNFNFLYLIVERNKRKVFKRNLSLFPPALFKYINWVKPIRMELGIKSRYAQQTNSNSKFLSLTVERNKRKVFKRNLSLFLPALFKYMNWVKPIRMELETKK